MDKIITSGWAMKEDPQEKGKTNYEAYLELREKYKIWSSGLKKYVGKGQYEPIDQDKYDVIYECVGTGYANKRYRVYKNAPNLAKDELALICDGGNLCFGYCSMGNEITVYTD